MATADVYVFVHVAIQLVSDEVFVGHKSMAQATSRYDIA